MRRLAVILFAVLLALFLMQVRARDAARAQVAPRAQAVELVRFGHVDVFIEPTGAPLAAYQCEITATAGDVTLVGIEGGEHAAFKVPPYYDPKALGQKRIILGAFNTGADLPRGKTRVARLMVQITGDARPTYEAKVQVAASGDGKAIPATISLSDPDSEGAER